MVSSRLSEICGPAAMRAGLLALMLATVSSGVRSDPVADFYKGKRVNVLIGVNVGGGYDLEARLIARFIGDYTPGNPTFVPQNVIGAGGLRMANQLYNVAPRDGTHLGMFPNTLIALQAVGGEGVQYRAEHFNWLGTLSTSPITIATWHTTGVRTIDDLRKRPVSIAASTPGAITYSFPFLVNQVLGTNIKIVTGYQGTSQMVVAMERGEVDAVVNSWSSWKSMQRDWLNENKINVLVQSDPKAKDLPAPSISELATNEADKALINLVLAGDQLGKPMALTPDVPKDRVEAIRAAYAKTIADPEFLKIAEKARVDVEPVFGDALQRIIEKALATPKDIALRAKSIIQ